jgi:hypothetical protein
MPITTEAKTSAPAPGTLRQRLLWFVGLYFAGLLSVAALAYGLRAVLFW